MGAATSPASSPSAARRRLRGHGRHDVPVGAGLSSSAALEVAVALALGFDGLAARPRRAVPAGRAAGHAACPAGSWTSWPRPPASTGHALLIDCTTLDVDPVPLPDGVDVVVVHSGEPRTLAGSAYAERRAPVRGGERIVGPLRDADARRRGAASPTRRAAPGPPRRHRERAGARRSPPRSRPATSAPPGELWSASHASLRDDFEVSTPALDALVARLSPRPGVLGARLTGAGFGGCVVALARPGAVREGWAGAPARPAPR